MIHFKIVKFLTETAILANKIEKTYKHTSNIKIVPQSKYVRFTKR